MAVDLTGDDDDVTHVWLGPASHNPTWAMRDIRWLHLDKPAYNWPCGVVSLWMNRTLLIHAWLVAVLLIGVLCLMALLLGMMHVHAGDVAYITRTHRPIIFVTPRPPVIPT